VGYPQLLTSSFSKNRSFFVQTRYITDFQAGLFLVEN
jgi:hypothetical protein